MKEEREIDDEYDESEETKTKGEFKVRPRHLAPLTLYKLSPRHQRISETMKESVVGEEKERDSEYKVEEQVAKHEKAGIKHDDDDDGAAEDNTKPGSGVRPRPVRAEWKIRRLQPAAAGTESESRERQEKENRTHTTHQGGVGSESGSDYEPHELRTEIFAGLTLRRARRHERKGDSLWERLRKARELTP